MDGKKITTRLSQLESDRQVVQSQWETITQYVRPFGQRPFHVNPSESAIQWRQRDIYDSTALYCAWALASFMHGAMTSTRWFRLAFRNPEHGKDHEMKKWLERAGDMLYSGIEESEFSLEVAKAYYDMTTYGPACLMMEQVDPRPGVWKGVEFTLIPVKEVYFEPDSRGRALNYYRKMEWPISRLVDMFGPDSLPEEVMKKFGADAKARETVVFCIYRRLDQPKATGMKLLADHLMPYGYKYVLFSSGKEIGSSKAIKGYKAGSGGYYSMPVYLPRWADTSESMWGHSPTQMAMGHILSLNDLARQGIVAGERGLKPPQKTEDRNLIGPLRSGAGGLTVMRDINRTAPLQTGTYTADSRADMRQMRDEIRHMFMLPLLEVKESPAMTAYETSIRYQQMMRYLAPTAGRTRVDMLDPMVRDKFAMMVREGVLDPNPAKVSGVEIDITYSGLLARSLNSDEAGATQAWAADLLEKGQVDPRFAGMVDPIGYATETHRSMSVPAGAMRDPKVVKKEHKAMAEQEEQMRQAAVDKEIAVGVESMGKGAKALSEAG